VVNPDPLDLPVTAVHLDVLDPLEKKDLEEIKVYLVLKGPWDTVETTVSTETVVPLDLPETRSEDLPEAVEHPDLKVPLDSAKTDDLVNVETLVTPVKWDSPDPKDLLDLPDSAHLLTVVKSFLRASREMAMTVVKVLLVLPILPRFLMQEVLLMTKMTAVTNMTLVIMEPTAAKTVNIMTIIS